MAHLILKASRRNPELLNSLNLQDLSKSQLILGVNLLAVHRIQPPPFYSQFVFNFLYKHPKFSRVSFLLSGVQTNSLTAIIKTFISNYHKLQITRIEEFDTRESIDMISSISRLCTDERYNDTAKWILEELCDRIIRMEDFLSLDESIEVLKAIWERENLSAVETLRDMCKARIYADISSVKGSLGFYQKVDEFFKAIN